MADFKACCDPGTEWEGSPVGQVATLASLEAYISKPENALPGSPAILLIHDIHGWDLKNVRLYADKLAKEGFLAVVPDFYHGKALKPLEMSGVPAFIAQFPREKVVPELHAVVKALREEHGAANVGAQGFCWGGIFTALLLAGSGGVDAGVISHGSLLKEEDVKAIERPVWFQFSGLSDKQIPPQFREQIEEILKSKPKSGSKYYEDQEHGWVMRGDDKDPRVAAGADDAFKGALEFFRAHLGSR